MPYARFETDTIRARFADIARRDRAQAIAAHSAAVLISAELLLDGRLSTAHWVSACDDAGVANPKRISAVLVAAKLLKRGARGTLEIAEWEAFHTPRADVLAKRKQAAERQKKARQQAQFPLEHTETPAMSRCDKGRDIERDASARARVGTRDPGVEAAAETEKGEGGSPPKTGPAHGRPAGWPDDPLLDPAAAAEAAAPTELQLTKLLTAFPDADRNSLTVIQPLAQALDARTVLQLAWNLRDRTKPGGIGLLVDRLRDTVRERLATHAAQDNGQTTGVDTTSRIERLKREEPEAYLKAMAGVLDPDDITAYLDTYVHDDQQRYALADLAANLRETTAP